MSKTVVLMLLALLTLSSLVMAGSVFAQSVPKPSIPEFTVQLVTLSYDVPITTSVDPYTGSTETHGGYHVVSQIIEVRIKNEPFTSFVIEGSNRDYDAEYLYNIRWKGHFEDSWHGVYYGGSRYLYRIPGDETIYPPLKEPSTGLGIENTYLYDNNIPTYGQLDFQVEAMIGYLDDSDYPNLIFVGESSGWSNTQTLNIGESQTDTPTPFPSSEPTVPTSPTPLPFEEPQQLSQDVILGVAVTVAVLAVGLGLLVYLIKRK